MGMNLNRMEKKKKFVVCGNGIAEIEERYIKKYAYSYSFSIFFDQNSLVCHVLLWQKKSGMKLWQWHCQTRREKNLFQLVCGNAIAEIERKKIVAMNLWQWHCRNRMKNKIVAIGLWQWQCRNRGEIKKNTHILILSVFFFYRNNLVYHVLLW